MHTSCKDCSFAQWNGNTQVGCRAGRLEKFAEAVLEVYDEEKEFFVINGKICNMKDDTSVSLEDKRNSIALSYCVIVPLTTGFSSEAIGQTCQVIASQTLQPQTVFFVEQYGASGRHPAELNELIRGSVPENASFAWRITRMLRETASPRELVDEVSAKLSKGFFLVVEPGHSLPPQYMENLDKLVNDDLKPILVVTPFNGEMNGLVALATFANHPFTEQNRGGFFDNPRAGQIGSGMDIEPEKIWCETLEQKVKCADPLHRHWIAGVELV